MLKSMTGYGSADGEVDDVQYAVEVRSVNNRYLKVSLRLPESIQPLEARLEQAVRDRIGRGTVNVSVRMKVPEEQVAHRINTTVLETYVEQLRVVEVEANPMFRLDIGSLLQLPGVCEPPALEELAERTADGLEALLIEALETLIEMRSTEGSAIVEDLLVNASQIEKNLEYIDGCVEQVVRQYHDRLATRVAELTNQAKIDIDEETLAREVAIFAERSDIAEEISRLRTHVTEFRKLCETDDAVGRKLDFMAQEMLREANTIASKSSDADIARRVVDVKTCIDRIKEQAANIE
jgi:uncharacterized protein (TIGR00255 family)